MSRGWGTENFREHPWEPIPTKVTPQPTWTPQEGNYIPIEIREDSFRGLSDLGWRHPLYIDSLEDAIKGKWEATGNAETVTQITLSSQNRLLWKRGETQIWGEYQLNPETAELTFSGDQFKTQKLNIRFVHPNYLYLSGDTLVRSAIIFTRVAKHPESENGIAPEIERYARDWMELLLSHTWDELSNRTCSYQKAYIFRSHFRDSRYAAILNAGLTADLFTYDLLVFNPTSIDVLIYAPVTINGNHRYLVDIWRFVQEGDISAPTNMWCGALSLNQ